MNHTVCRKTFHQTEHVGTNKVQRTIMYKSQASHLGTVVNQVALGHVFHLVLRFSPVSISPPMFHIPLSIYYRYYTISTINSVHKWNIKFTIFVWLKNKTLEEQFEHGNNVNKINKVHSTCMQMFRSIYNVHNRTSHVNMSQMLLGTNKVVSACGYDMTVINWHVTKHRI